MKWERARTKEQKGHRISKIIDATARLYQQHSFEEITFVSIAREANFTRSNLYKYFNTKEEIFFEFLKHDMILWRQDLENSFQKSKTYPVKEFASIWLKTQRKHERMLKIVSLLHTALEKNSSKESLIAFKRAAKKEFERLTHLLCNLFPPLTLNNAFKFLNMQLAVCIGLYEMTHLSENQQSVLTMPEFEPFRIDYDTYFQQSIEYLIQGLL